MILLALNLWLGDVSIRYDLAPVVEKIQVSGLNPVHEPIVIQYDR